jgi:hypothetical protein
METDMTKQISNTLTRWHKIAERVKQAANELAQKNFQAIQAGRNLDADTFSVRKAALQTTVGSAVGEQTSLYFALQDALFGIRRALAHANVRHGVADLLNEMEQAKQKANYFSNLVDSSAGALSVSEYSALCAKRNANSAGMYGANVTFLSAEELADLTEKRDAARREVNALADRLADANASKLSLDISEEVAKVVGL